MAIDRDTELTFGKHKGEPLRRVPTGYLEWAVDGGIDSKGWRAAFERELAERKRPAGQTTEGPRDNGKGTVNTMGGKKYLDTMITAFEYTMLALSDLGHSPAPDSPAYVQGHFIQAVIEASQKIAVSAAIYAERSGVDLESEIRPLVNEKWRAKKRQVKQDADDSIPF